MTETFTEDREYALDDLDLPFEPEPAIRRRAPGPRTRAIRDQTRRRRRRRRLLIPVLWFVLVAVIVAGYKAIEPGGDSIKTGQLPSVDAGPTQTSWLVIGTLSSNPDRGADWLAVLSWDSKHERGIVLYVPRSTYTELGGFGQEIVGAALSLGREPLLVSSVANLIGIQLDHFLEISDQGVRALVDKAGGLSIEVQTPLQRKEPGGRVVTLFSSGVQTMNGEQVAQFLSFVDESGDEVSRGVLHTEVWRALLEKFSGEPGSLGDFMLSSTDLIQTDADEAELKEFFRDLGRGWKDVVSETLPVSATGVASAGQFYAPDREGIEALVARYLSGSRPRGASGGGRRLEILNGNGSPGIGQRVAEQLVPAGFRVVLSQNARSFDYETTQIVVYSRSKSALEVAEEIKEILKVGEIVVSRQAQTIVDVTIVVGKDYVKEVPS